MTPQRLGLGVRPIKACPWAQAVAIHPSMVRPAVSTEPALIDRTSVRAPIKASRTSRVLTRDAAETLRLRLRGRDQIGPSAPAEARVSVENRIVLPP